MDVLERSRECKLGTTDKASERMVRQVGAGQPDRFNETQWVHLFNGCELHSRRSKITYDILTVERIATGHHR